MNSKTKKVRRKSGDIFLIPLKDGIFAYGQVVNDVAGVFFDYRDDGTAVDLTKINISKVLFKIRVNSCCDQTVITSSIA